MDVERLLLSARKKIPDIAIAELTLNKRGSPDWRSISFTHPSVPEVGMLFVVEPNAKSDVAELAHDFGKLKEFSVIRRAPKVIWAQHKRPLELPERTFRQGWDTFNKLILAVAGVSGGVILSPEAERLFTSTAFRRQHLRHSKAFSPRS